MKGWWCSESFEEVDSVQIVRNMICMGGEVHLICDAYPPRADGSYDHRWSIQGPCNEKCGNWVELPPEIRTMVQEHLDHRATQPVTLRMPTLFAKQ